LSAKTQDIYEKAAIQDDVVVDRDTNTNQLEALRCLQKRLDRCVELPSPPAIAVRVLEAVRDDQESFRALAQVVSSDPALTAKMLKIANLSIYGLTGQVDTIEMALTVLGSRALKNIALSFVLISELQNACQGNFDFTKFWKASIVSAIAAEEYSDVLGEKREDTFVSALLQNIGYLVMFLTDSEKFYQMVAAQGGPESENLTVERNIFGFDHQEFGVALLKSWGLPETIYMPILSHHFPLEALAKYQETASLVFVSHQIALVYQGFNTGEKACQLQKWLHEKHQMSAVEVEKLIDSIAGKANEILATFAMGTETVKPYSELLQEANQELGKLNLSYEQVLIDLQGAKNQAQNLATRLLEANQTLNTLAFCDGLTGLYNHRYFQEKLEIELKRSMRQSYPLSLIFFDIDYFKKINDSHGHLTGDLLLKNLAGRVGKIIRSSDILARYGGEEFAIILPETDVGSLRVFAERVRRGIEQLNVEVKGQIVQITVSIGGTTKKADFPLEDKRILIRVADQALYESKNLGRNKFTYLPLKDFN
jgi:diguanylate cyclase (GGDEF)-like protein